MLPPDGRWGDKTHPAPREMGGKDWQELDPTVAAAADAAGLVGVLNALQDSERRYRDLFEQMIDGFALHEILCDESGRPVDYRFLDINPAFEAITGLRREAVVGRTARDVLPDLERRWIQIYGEVALTGRSARFENYSASLDRHFEVAAYSPRAGHFATIFVDVTSRVRAEEALRRSEEKLLQSQKMEAVGRLAGGLAHDFNNLLTAILGYSDLAAMRMEPEDPRRHELTEIQSIANRAAVLCQQLLAFSRKQALQPVLFDLNAAVAEAGRMLRRLIGEDIYLELFPDPTPAMVHADPIQMQQVLLNLAVNARDAMPHGGRLSISTSHVDVDEAHAAAHVGARPGPHVLLTVADTGHGMDPDTLARACEPFFTTKAPGSGTGLGLATVHGIVHQSGGYLSIESQVGQGSVFYVYLPSAAAEARAERKGHAAARAAGGRETVLVVEDDDLLRHLVQEVLKKFGYRVLAAPSAVDAMAEVGAEPGPVHLLLTDVLLPGASGPELAENLKALQPGLKVVFMSGHSEDVIAEHGGLAPNSPFLAKPFQPDALAKAVREALDA